MLVQGEASPATLHSGLLSAGMYVYQQESPPCLSLAQGMLSPAIDEDELLAHMFDMYRIINAKSVIIPVAFC